MFKFIVALASEVWDCEDEAEDIMNDLVSTVAPNAGYYKDIYDGKIWLEFQTLDGLPFLAGQNTFGFMLNVDWFQPCKHVQYSVGALYLAIMNLPRHLRFKRENILLCGITPGPNEPKNINEFLAPLVDDLLTLLAGVELNVHGGKVVVKGALLCVDCDLPAARKVCGFLSYTATLGCSRCKKQFPGEIGKKDYSGFDRNTWFARNVNDHRHQVNIIESCTTKATRMRKESEFGV